MIKKESPSPDVHYLQCGYCHWNSISIGAQAEAPAPLIGNSICYHPNPQLNKCYSVALLRRERESSVQRQYAQIHDKRRPLKSPSKPRIKSVVQRPYNVFDAATHPLLLNDAADLVRVMNLGDGDIATGKPFLALTPQSPLPVKFNTNRLSSEQHRAAYTPHEQQQCRKQ